MAGGVGSGYNPFNRSGNARGVTWVGRALTPEPTVAALRATMTDGAAQRRKAMTDAIVAEQRRKQEEMALGTGGGGAGAGAGGGTGTGGGGLGAALLAQMPAAAGGGAGGAPVARRRLGGGAATRSPFSFQGLRAMTEAMGPTKWGADGLLMPATVEARATGGPVRRGRPYLVGEEGPELVVPQEDATVIPSDALWAQASGEVPRANGVSFLGNDATVVDVEQNPDGVYAIPGDSPVKPTGGVSRLAYDAAGRVVGASTGVPAGPAWSGTVPDPVGDVAGMRALDEVEEALRRNAPVVGAGGGAGSAAGDQEALVARAFTGLDGSKTLAPGDGFGTAFQGLAKGRPVGRSMTDPDRLVEALARRTRGDERTQMQAAAFMAHRRDRVDDAEESARLREEALRIEDDRWQRGQEAQREYRKAGWDREDAADAVDRAKALEKQGQAMTSNAERVAGLVQRGLVTPDEGASIAGMQDVEAQEKRLQALEFGASGRTLSAAEKKREEEKVAKEGIAAVGSRAVELEKAGRITAEELGRVLKAQSPTVAESILTGVLEGKPKAKAPERPVVRMLGDKLIQLDPVTGKWHHVEPEKAGALPKAAAKPAAKEVVPQVREGAPTVKPEPGAAPVKKGEEKGAKGARSYFK